MTPILYIKNKLMAAKKKVVEKVEDVITGNYEVVNGYGAVQGTFTNKKEAEEFAGVHGFILK